MSMFSFLTGKKDAVEDVPAAAPVAETTNQEPSAAPESQTPFAAPEAWNAEALKSPKPETEPSGAQVGPLDAEQTAAFQSKIVEAIKTVFDPEIPVDIYELGLIYDIIVDGEKRALINMTLTSPACPSAQQLPLEVRFKVKAIPEIKDAKVDIVWEPAWTKERMSEAAKLTLGFF